MAIEKTKEGYTIRLSPEYDLVEAMYFHKHRYAYYRALVGKSRGTRKCPGYARQRNCHYRYWKAIESVVKKPKE